ncbi:MAG: hypothetical protein K6E29_03865, partial [Cyanobacteria bacterium RUI128]|nr:hypothetical protein [Cyanobacteria bacterium RUI128]
MAVEPRVLTIDFTNPKKVKSTYDLKKYDVVKIITSGNENFIEGIDSATASGAVLTIKVAEIVEQGQQYPSKTVKFKNVRDDISVQAWGSGDNTPYYNETFETFYFEDEFGNDEKTWLTNASSTSVTGTAFGETIDVSTAYTPTTKNAKKNIGVKINAGDGGDTIIGTKYNDTITGGLGNNTVVYDDHYVVQGQDTINLTKGENLTIDLTAYGISSVDGFLGLSGGRFKRSGNDLILRLSESTEATADFVRIKNFYKTNGVGDEGSVKVLLKKAEELTPEISVNLNSDVLFSYADADFAKNNKKKTATFAGTRLSENVTVGDDLNGYNKTIKMGDGENTVNMTGTGTNTIILGKDNDTVNIGATDDVLHTKTTIKAGKGDNNVININSKTTFGEVIIAEEKVGATNVINFQNGVVGYTLYKSGDDLVVMYAPDQSSVTVKGYYASDAVKAKYHYATVKFQVGGTGELDYDDLVTAAGGFV